MKMETQHPPSWNLVVEAVAAWAEWLMSQIRTAETEIENWILSTLRSEEIGADRASDWEGETEQGRYQEWLWDLWLDRQGRWWCQLNEMENWQGQVWEKSRVFFFLIFIYWFERERGRQRRERKTSICSIYLCIHWLILVCALTRDQTCDLGVLGRCSNQLSYPARARNWVLWAFSSRYMRDIQMGMADMQLDMQV